MARSKKIKIDTFLIIQKNLITKYSFLIFAECKAKHPDMMQIIDNLNHDNKMHKYRAEEKKYFKDNFGTIENYKNQF